MKSMPSLAIDGATRADRDDDEAHVRRDVTVLMATRFSRDRKVSRQSRLARGQCGELQCELTWQHRGS